MSFVVAPNYHADKKPLSRQPIADDQGSENRARVLSLAVVI